MPGPAPTAPDGFVVWIEGLPGSGKSTLARGLSERLRAQGRATEVLDGQAVRETFFPELGYSRKDRETQARRVSQLARILAGHDIAVIVAMITPYETSRQAARAAFGGRFAEVWLNCPIEVCETRDPRGLYKGSHEGRLTQVTGLDDPFEEPLDPDLVLETGRQPVGACLDRLVGHLTAHRFLPA